jgi:hypothetical protein
MKRIIVYLGCWLVALMAQAQQTDWMEKLSDEHPRYLTNASDKKDVKYMIEKESWASTNFDWDD